MEGHRRGVPDFPLWTFPLGDSVSIAWCCVQIGSEDQDTLASLFCCGLASFLITSVYLQQAFITHWPQRNIGQFSICVSTEDIASAFRELGVKCTQMLTLRIAFLKM